MAMAGTREVKSPVFYIVVGETTAYWHVKKNKKLFKVLDKMLGTPKEKMPSNY